MNNTNFKSRALKSLFVIFPLFLFIFAHYTMDTAETNLLPTGFFNGEAPYYMANARQYVDHGFGNLFYGNPFSYLQEGQRVYFQFQTYILAILIKLLPLSINSIWLMFGVIFSFLFMYQTTRVLDLLGVNKKNMLLMLFLFAWGGGVHGILGFLSEFFSTFNFIESIKALEKFEIADGWWMQSVGRNFLMPNYIYYHFLVMSGLLFIIKRMNKSLIGLCFILSFSHPFVGAQFIFSVVVWTIFERYYLSSRDTKVFSTIAFIIVLAVHVLYYFKFLTISSEHVAQEAQWSVTYESLYKNWAMRAINFIPSYILAFGLFFYQIRSPEKFLRFFKNHTNRFLATFGVINFVLANHEFAMKPIQPIHFTHGMVWFPFVLLGRQTLIDILNSIKSRNILASLGLVSFIALFISDNLLWMAKRGYQSHIGQSQTELPLTRNHKSAIDFINKNLGDNNLFFVQDLVLGFHLTVYTSNRVFASHNIITPHSQKRKSMQNLLFEKGIVPSEVKESKVYILKSDPQKGVNIGESIYKSEKYELFEYKK